MRLESKCTVLTGAGSGIGQALALALAAKGARLLLVGRRPDALERTLASLPEAARHDASIVAADITEAQGRQAIRDAVTRRFERLDLLINNAGVVPVGALEDTSEATIETALRTNLTAPILLVRALLEPLREGRPSRVINVGSMFGDIAFPLFAAYSASKFGLRGFSDALRRELAPEGIGVTYVAPRATRTPAADGFQALVKPLAMRLDPPERVAAGIVSAIEREARSLYPRGPERLFVLIQRLFPGLVDRDVIAKAAKPQVRALLRAPTAE